MKNTLFILLAITFLMAIDSAAQDTLQGTVKYELITKLDFSKRPGRGPDDQRFKDFIASLPEESRIVKTLYFNETNSLYQEIATENAELDPKVRRATFFMSMGRKPRPAVEQVYLNLEKDKVVEQLDFMTRDFIVEGEKESNNWKLSMDKKKILGYVCMNAEAIIQVDSMKTDTIIAWFSPEIPVSTGPDRYYGLPGLVLAVEKNGETILLASSIDFKTPVKELIVKPTEGKKVTKEELDKIIEEKVKEFEATRGQGGHGGGRPH